MATKYHQLSLADSFKDCKDMVVSDTPSFFHLLEEHLDLEDFIPTDFYLAFYKSIGRKRDYPLTGFLSALIIQKIFSISTDSLLLLLLHICSELRDFCGYLELMFHELVDFTEPICQAIDSSLSSMLTFDTSGIELYVTENNSKTLDALIKRLKSFYKDNPDVDPYKNGLWAHASSCRSI